MNNIPKISVIVPVYNADRYLHCCIDSILQQAFTDFELLLVDDGSTDFSGEICDDYVNRDRRISVFHQENKGVSFARNMALTYAKGKWVVFVDSDDEVESVFLSCFFEKGDPNNDCLSFVGLKRIDSEGRIVWEKKYSSCLTSLQDWSIISDNRILHNGEVCGKLYNLEIIKKHSISFNSELSLHEDHLFFFEYLLYMKTINLSSSVSYKYHQREKGKSLSSHMNNSYNELYLSYTCLWEKLNLLLDNNIKLSASYEKSIRHFLYSVFIYALVALYKTKDNDINTLNILKQIERKDIKSFYHPKALSGRILKFLLLYSPNRFTDLVLKNI